MRSWSGQAALAGGREAWSVSCLPEHHGRGASRGGDGNRERVAVKLCWLVLLLLLCGATGWGREPSVPGSRPPTIPELKASVSFSQWLQAFQSQGVIDSGLDSCLPVVFHGSPLKFDRVEPYPSTRASQNGIDWKGEAIFATADPRVALFYTYTRVKGFTCGINLRRYTSPVEPVVYHLYGGKSRDEALGELYGRPQQPESCPGWIYVLNKQFFYREQGLGVMECISRDSRSNLWRLEVDRRGEIEAAVKSGSIVLEWSAAL